ncbi:MAG: hypothetical protein RL336_1484 [Pseudomonadota bacterium]
MKSKFHQSLIAGAIAASLSLTALAAPAERKLLWGDTHLHTSNSADVFIFDLRNSTPDTAYRFAKGLPVIAPTTNQMVRLNQPLDFLVVADHAELLGSVKRIFSGDPEFSDSVTGKVIRDIEQREGNLLSAYGNVVTALFRGKDEATGLTGQQVMQDMQAGKKRLNTWMENTAAADFHNEPGKFTAFIGWEWSSMVDGANLHRVVITDSDAETANTYLPFSQFESSDPEDLWAWLGRTSKSTGANFLAIPHNPNISRGQMFSETKFDKVTPIDKAYSETRRQWEPLLEVTQIKGDSETHPVLSPNDEFADFEPFNFILMPTGEREVPTKADFARSALKTGLVLGEQNGINPFKFGMIGSTDSHTGMSAVEETAFAGKAKHDSTPQNRHDKTGIGSSIGWDMSSGGYAAVWADDNTRADIFSAMQRKETYATTGPRIQLRFFGGWTFNERDITRDNIAQQGYAKGVSMGGDLPVRSSNTAPHFMVEAIADPYSGSLERIQIVKGWLDAKGIAQEKVFNVVGAHNSQPDAAGHLQATQDTIDLKTARYDRSTGSEELRALWVDPEFDPTQQAFYYARVLEIPTPRYSLYDAIALQQDPAVTNKPTSIQERAYSSPIWYNSK